MVARVFPTQRTMPAAQPMADDVRGLQRREEAELGQAVESLAVVSLGRKSQRRLTCTRRVLEQAGVVVLNFMEMIEQNLGESVAAGKAKKSREALEPGALRRQRLRLLVVDHLQPVLDRAQKNIGRLHIVARRRIDPAVLAQLVEGGECIAVAQMRVKPAGA